MFGFYSLFTFHVSLCFYSPFTFRLSRFFLYAFIHYSRFTFHVLLSGAVVFFRASSLPIFRAFLGYNLAAT
jgi:hypothetical protein